MPYTELTDGAADAVTATKIKAVKLTFANAVSSGYKEVDAVQLVGE